MHLRRTSCRRPSGSAPPPGLPQCGPREWSALLAEAVGDHCVALCFKHPLVAIVEQLSRHSPGKGA